MKKLSISAFAFAAMFSVSTLTADNVTNTYNLAGTPVSVTAKDQSVVVLFKNAKVNELVSVQITTEKGDVILKESIEKSKRYNLSRLERGDYTIILTKKDAKTIQPFAITEGGVVIEEKAKKAYFTPKIVRKNASLQVNVLTGQYTNIAVRIQDARGVTVFEDKHFVIFRLHKAYNVAQLPEGNYTVLIQAGEETYSEEFTKD